MKTIRIVETEGEAVTLRRRGIEAKEWSAPMTGSRWDRIELYLDMEECRSSGEHSWFKDFLFNLPTRLAPGGEIVSIPRQTVVKPADIYTNSRLAADVLGKPEIIGHVDWEKRFDEHIDKYIAADTPFAKEQARTELRKLGLSDGDSMYYAGRRSKRRG